MTRANQHDDRGTDRENDGTRPETRVVLEASAGGAGNRHVSLVRTPGAGTCRRIPRVISPPSYPGYKNLSESRGVGGAF